MIVFLIRYTKKCNHYKFSLAAAILFLLILAFFTSPAYSAITYVSNANIYSGSASTSMIFTTSANSNRALIFCAGIRDERAEYNITSVSYGAQYFTFLTRTASGPGDGTGITAEVWYLLNPVSGGGTITMSQASAMWKSMGVSEYCGVSSIGSGGTAAANTNSLTVPFVTTQDRSWISGIFTQRNGSKMNINLVTPGLLSRWSRQSKTPPTNIYIRSIGHDLPTTAAGNYGIQIDSNRTDYCGMGEVEIKAASPTVIACYPAVGWTGGGQPVTITGTNFDNGCTLTIGGNPAAVTYINSTTLRIIAPAHTAGAVDVVVTNIDFQQATGTAIYTYSPFQAPVIVSCNPSSGSTLGGQAVTVTGANFISGCAATIGGIAATGVIFVNSTTLMMTSPAHAAGVTNVTVTNPDMQSGNSNNAFTYVIPPPLVTSCSPASGLAAGGQQITITGKYFVNGCTAAIGGAAATGITFLDTMTLRVTTPAHAAGAADVSVRNPDSQANTLTAGFTYFGQLPPLVSSCSPASGPTTGGQTITVNGSDFNSLCTASIGGISAAVAYLNPSSIILTTPAHAAGTVDVIVTNPDFQSSTLPASYTYAVPPSVSSCAPASGSTAGGQTITINGLNFRTGCSAAIDGIPCAITRASSAEILLTTPAHAEGAVNVTVYNNDNTYGVLAAGFTYDGTAPVILLNGGGADVTVAAGDTYTEAATASDNIDGDLTPEIAVIIRDGLGAIVSGVTTASIQAFTITYDVSDAAMNAALRVTRVVHVTDQAPPVISLNSGGAAITLMTGQTYTEAATAADNIDGDLTSAMAIVIKDHLGTTVGSVSTAAPETYTITYDVSDAALNAAVRVTRTVNVINVALNSIDITVLPLKLAFKVGETLDVSGMVVLGYFADSSTATLNVTAANVTGFSSLAAANGQVLTVTINGQSDTYSVDIIELNSIFVNPKPSKLVYDIGEILDISGMVVTGTYSNGSAMPETVTLSDISGFSSAAAVTGQIVTVTVDAKTDTFTVNIVPTLAGIAITTPASKLVYDIGDALDIAGMVVTGTYTDSSQKTETITAGNVSGLNTTSAQTGQVLTVTVSGKTATYTVDIIPTLVSIAVTTPASKLVFNVGEPLSIAGMVVTGTYTDSNNKTETVTTGNVTGFNSSVPATGQVLTVTVGGKTATYTVDIVQPLLMSIAITTPASKLVYTVGEALDITGMIVTGTYDDLSTGIMPVTDSNVTGFDSSLPAANQVLTVTCGGRTAVYQVQIMALPPLVSSCLPSSGTVAGGQSITVYGDNFVTGCTVTIGGIAASAVSFVDEFTLIMNTPAHANGIVDIVVTNPDTQQGTGAGIYTYLGGPTFTMTPTSTRTRTPTATPSWTNTAVYSATNTPTSTRTSTAGPSSTTTKTRTATGTGTQTQTRTATATVSATPTISETHTVSPTSTDTPIASATHTGTATGTATRTVTCTGTVSLTPTVTPTGGYAQAPAGESYVYPQPAADVLNIIYSIDSTADVMIYVYNAAGMPVADFINTSMPGGSNKAVLDISGFARGVYYYVIRTKDLSGKTVNFKPDKFLVLK